MSRASGMISAANTYGFFLKVTENQEEDYLLACLSGIIYASYDNASGEIRLHINIGNAAGSPVSLIHEAIHALHASRYPKLSRMYAEVGNLSQSPEFRRNPDITARQERDVVASIARVRELMGEIFDPSNWTPPRSIPHQIF
jgi:hypothetical protein